MIIILMGPPGSGKGTQAVQLAEKLGIPHISTGVIFRHELSNSTPLGIQARSYMDAGELVPDSVVTDMVRERTSQKECADGYILDGYPRTIPQAEAYDSILSDNCTCIDKVFNLTVDEDTIIKRLTGRMACENCTKDFNRYFSPPEKEGVCDVCGGCLVSRSDDNEETVKNRLKVYAEETEPLIDYYADRVIDIDGSGTPEKTLNEITEILDGK